MNTLKGIGIGSQVHYILLPIHPYFQNLGFQNYWQITFVILTAIIIACNIGLMFVPEQQPTERQAE